LFLRHPLPYDNLALTAAGKNCKPSVSIRFSRLDIGNEMHTLGIPTC
jgi:hypothetical protein